MGKSYWQKKADRMMEPFNRAPANKCYKEEDVRTALASVQGLTERDIDLVVSDTGEGVGLSEFTKRMLGSGKTEDVRKALTGLKQLPIEDDEDRLDDDMVESDGSTDENEGSCYEPGEEYGGAHQNDSFDDMAHEPFSEKEEEEIDDKLEDLLALNRNQVDKS